MIFSAYQYLYSNLYEWSVKINGEDYYNHFSASLMISTIVIINAGTIFSIASILGVWVWPSTSVFKMVAAAFMLTTVLANVFYFSREKRGQKIVESFRAARGDAARPEFVSGCALTVSLCGLFLSWLAGLNIQ